MIILKGDNSLALLWVCIQFLNLVHVLATECTLTLLCKVWKASMSKPSKVAKISQSSKQGWGTYGPHEHLIWPASEFSLPELEYSITLKRSSTSSRYLDSKSKEVTLPYS